ncbi:YciK family oxidoreductase [Ketobacter sp.]|uniref:YciK family oxidoreductase n=1 Tax=Ketobacter sp. TaxID=2083498 RepID=UPI000F227044|nr:YciK family oxidoreductase [Ketobacter sp.]RLT92518.1 MAG: YciK family oxidoreductase [Ketobacter sp.]
MNQDYTQYQAPDNLLQDKVILVTGAGAGIGKAAALSFARLGATVVLLGRTVEKLEQVYDQIEAEGGKQPAIVPLNLESASHVEYRQIAETIEQEFGRLDGLLLNAAILGDIRPLEFYPMDLFEKVMATNVNAQFMLVRTLLPLLRQSEQGSIVFTTSSVGRVGRANWGAYAISKFAVEGMMQTLADELKDTSNIKVNCVNPGATRTGMRASAYPAEEPASVCPPDAIMPLYNFLMGTDSQGVTGQSLDAQKK